MESIAISAARVSAGPRQTLMSPSAHCIRLTVSRCYRRRDASRTFATSRQRLSKSEYSKLYGTADDAVADVRSGSTLLSSGFGLCGVAGKLFVHSGDPNI